MHMESGCKADLLGYSRHSQRRRLRGIALCHDNPWQDYGKLSPPLKDSMSFSQLRQCRKRVTSYGASETGIGCPCQVGVSTPGIFAESTETQVKVKEWCHKPQVSIRKPMISPPDFPARKILCQRVTVLSTQTDSTAERLTRSQFQHGLSHGLNFYSLLHFIVVINIGLPVVYGSLESLEYPEWFVRVSRSYGEIIIRRVNALRLIIYVLNSEFKGNDSNITFINQKRWPFVCDTVTLFRFRALTPFIKKLKELKNFLSFLSCIEPHGARSDPFLRILQLFLHNSPYTRENVVGLTTAHLLRTE